MASFKIVNPEESVFQTWLYVSHASEFEISATERLAELDVQCRRHNAAVGITGTLLFTGTYFAQLLEGPKFAVEHLRPKIMMDPRHRDVATLRMEVFAERSSGSRSFLTVFNQSTFVKGIIDEAFGTDASRVRTASLRLQSLLVEYCRDA